MNYVIYDCLTGEILRSGICPESMLVLQVIAGECFIEGIADDEFQYVDVTTKTLMDKGLSTIVLDKVFLQANGIDTITLSRIIPGSKVNIVSTVVGLLDQLIVVDDTILEFALEVVGTYNISVTTPSQLNYAITIEAI